MKKPNRAHTPLRRTLFTLLVGAAVAGLPLRTAQASCSSGGGTCTNTIKKLYVNGTGDPDYHYLELTGTEGAGAGCALQSGVYWRIPRAQADLYRFLMAVFLAGKQVTLRKTGDALCTISWATVQ